MNTLITITEVIERSKQGMTRPFVCAADFAIYYVKGCLCREELALLRVGGEPLGESRVAKRAAGSADVPNG